MASNTFGARMKAIGFESKSDGKVRRYPSNLVSAVVDSWRGTSSRSASPALPC